jgi:hypothetical protein
MEPVTMTARTPLQRLMMEKALAMAEELERVSDATADGQVLSELESLAVERGRDFTRQSLEGALQRAVDDVEKKLRRHACVPAAAAAETKAAHRARS